MQDGHMLNAGYCCGNCTMADNHFLRPNNVPGTDGHYRKVSSGACRKNCPQCVREGLQPYVGTPIRKRFKGEYYNGKVVRIVEKFGTKGISNHIPDVYARVEYDDGDAEDFSLDDIKKWA